MDRPRTQYARSGELSIAYSILGEGPLDVVMVPGFVSHIDLDWEHPLHAHAGRRFASFARFITFDKRGTGLSDRSVDAASTIEDRMDDIRAVMDAAGSERAAIVGYSEGGPMALAFAATYPDRVSALVLSGTFARRIVVPDLDRQLQAVERNWGTGRVIQFFLPTADADWASRLERSAATPTAAARILRLNATIDVAAALPAITVPTLVIHRRGDPVVSVEEGRVLGERISGARYIERDASTHTPATLEEWDEEVGDIQEFLTGVRDLDIERDRVLATVMFTDICSSTERAATLGDRAWTEVLVHHQREAASLVERYRGRAVKSTGDGVLATFDGPTRAVRCAAELVERSRVGGVEIRAGLHTGEVEVIGDDIAGIAVHLAQRVESKAEPGTVYVSQTVRDLLAGSNIALDDRGSHELKGVPGEWRLYAVAANPSRIGS